MSLSLSIRNKGLKQVHYNSIMDELVTLMYDISTLIPDQTYRQIMDHLTTIKNQIPEPGKERAVLEQLHLDVELDELLDNVDNTISFEFRIGNRPLPPRSLVQIYLTAIETPRLLNVRNMLQELEKAKAKIDTLTKMLGRARYNR